MFQPIVLQEKTTRIGKEAGTCGILFSKSHPLSSNNGIQSFFRLNIVIRFQFGPFVFRVELKTTLVHTQHGTSQKQPSTFRPSPKVVIPRYQEKLTFVLASDLQLLRALESPKWRLDLLHTGGTAEERDYGLSPLGKALQRPVRIRSVSFKQLEGSRRAVGVEAPPLPPLQPSALL